MTASIYQPRRKNKKIISHLKEAPLLHKTGIHFFGVMRMDIDL